MTTHEAPNGALRAPLNAALGTEANVRILRVLAERKEPLGRSEASRLAGITPQGGRRAIDRLVDQGVVEPVGSGPTQQVRLRDDWPLSEALRRLFQEERRRYESLRRDLSKTMDTLDPLPLTAWISGSVPRGTDEYGDPLIIVLLADAASVSDVADTFRQRIAELERCYDVTIEVRGITPADLPEQELDAVKPLWGPSPESFTAEPGQQAARIRGHRDQDERALARARRLAQELKENPALIERARRQVQRSMETASEHERHELREWDRLLATMSLARLRKFLVSESERATRLRQSSPFSRIAGILEHE